MFKKYYSYKKHIYNREKILSAAKKKRLKLFRENHVLVFRDKAYSDDKEPNYFIGVADHGPFGIYDNPIVMFKKFDPYKTDYFKRTGLLILNTGEIIYSAHRHDFVYDKDKKYFIDGGNEYIRTNVQHGDLCHFCEIDLFNMTFVDNDNDSCKSISFEMKDWTDE
jgi:hypothetical protein